MKNPVVLLSLLSVGLILQPHAAKAVKLTDGVAKEYVYVETNIKTPNGNSIAAFARDSNGVLTEIAGSPFLTGGAGTKYAGVNVGPQDSDQNIVTNPAHTLLFAVNSGSDTIAVFNINSDGSLTPVAGSPFPSGGNDPVSLGIDGNLLFVVNKSGDPGRPTSILPNYTAFRIGNGGYLLPAGDTNNESAHIYQTTVSVGIGSSPSQAFVIPGTGLLFGAEFFGGLIDRFRYDWNGELHQLPSLALPAAEYSDPNTPRLPLGLWAHPTQPYLYTGYVTNGKIGVYRYGVEGNLTFVRAVPTTGKAVCWLRTNSAGNRLYSSNTISNSISVYDSTRPDNPIQIQELPLSGLGNVLQFSLSSDGQYLYALSSRGAASIPEGQGNVLHTLTIQQDGTVEEVQAPILFNEPNNTRPQGVAVVPAN